jgi:transcriptional regulator with XRE-family HTH domain
MKTFSERFNSLRREGETQKEFADRLGVTQASVSRYLRNQHPDRESLKKIGEVTGVSVDWLLSGQESEMSQEVDDMVTKIGAHKTKPTEDKDWAEILLSYFDEMTSLLKEEKEYIKNIITAYVNEPDRRIELIDYWNYLRFREKNPTMPVPKRKRRVKR